MATDGGSTSFDLSVTVPRQLSTESNTAVLVEDNDASPAPEPNKIPNCVLVSNSVFNAFIQNTTRAISDWKEFVKTVAAFQGKKGIQIQPKFVTRKKTEPKTFTTPLSKKGKTLPRTGATSPMAVGNRVMVKVDGSEYAATIVAGDDGKNTGQIKIHYDGWNRTYDEWRHPASPSIAERLQSPRSQAFVPGDRVEVYSKGNWTEGKVLKVGDGKTDVRLNTGRRCKVSTSFVRSRFVPREPVVLVSRPAFVARIQGDGCSVKTWDDFKRVARGDKKPKPKLPKLRNDASNATQASNTNDWKGVRLGVTDEVKWNKNNRLGVVKALTGGGDSASVEFQPEKRKGFGMVGEIELIDVSELTLVKKNAVDDDLPTEEDISTHRNKWGMNSKVQIFSESQVRWLPGIISDMKMDEEGEWLIVRYGVDADGNMPFMKEVDRHDYERIRSAKSIESQIEAKMRKKFVQKKGASASAFQFNRQPTMLADGALQRVLSTQSMGSAFTCHSNTVRDLGSIVRGVEQMYVIGQKVDVEWEGKLLQAEVIEKKNGKLKLRYAGWSKEYDQWRNATTPSIKTAGGKFSFGGKRAASPTTRRTREVTKDQITLDFKYGEPGVTKSFDELVRDIVQSSSYEHFAHSPRNAGENPMDAARDKNKRSYMEDFYIVNHNLKIMNTKGNGFFEGPVRFAAVMDGHLGDGCAKAAAEWLPILITQELSKADASEEVEGLIQTALQTFDSEFMKRTKGKDLSGTTLTALLYDSTWKHAYTMNIGDSRAMTFNLDGSEARVLTNDHQPGDDFEFERIREAGGKVAPLDLMGAAQLSGDADDPSNRMLRRYVILAKDISDPEAAQKSPCVAVTRSLGDKSFKDAKLLSNEADIVRLPPGGEGFYVLATDGMFEAGVTETQVATVVSAQFSANGNIIGTSESLLTLSKESGSGDNIAVIVIGKNLGSTTACKPPRLSADSAGPHGKNVSL